MSHFTLAVLLCFAIVGVVLCAPTNSSDGDDRILHGRKATLSEYPYQVSLQHRKGNRVSKFCGGVILSKEWILTAAHCFMGSPPGNHSLYIHAGTVNAYDYKPPSQFIEVEETVLNDSWDPNTAIGDIALLKLKTPLKFTQVVQPIKLPPKNYVASGVGDIIGWGAINNDETAQTTELLSATVPVSKPSDCRAFRNFRSKQLCLAAKVKHNACAGDSGGPFIQKNTITGTQMVVGVTSFGADGCYEDKPIVYTEVAQYVDWIEKTMKSK